MATRGPKPKPTVIKRTFGNLGKRPLNDNEPEFRTYERLPKPPAGLNKWGRAEWLRIGNELLAAGILYRVGLRGVEFYCKCFQIYKMAEADINKNGLNIKTPNGLMQPNPSLSTLKSMDDKMRKWMIEFGLTPSAMSRISVKTPKQNKDGASSFFD